MKGNTKALLFKVAILAAYLLVAGAAFAQGNPGAPEQPSSGQVLLRMMPMLLMVFFIFYFMVLRPQERKLREQQELIEGMKKGDVVVTDSGIIGRVAAKDKDYILLEVAQNTKIKVETKHIAKRREKPSAEKSAA